MTRLAFVSPRWPGGGVVGGAETLLGRLATHAASRGVAVDFLTTCARNHHTWTNDDPPGAFDAAPGLRVHRFPVSEDRNLDTFLRIQERICRNQDVSPADQRAWMANSVHSPALYDHLRREGPHYHAILGGPYLFGVPHDALLIHPDRSWLVPCLHDESFAYQSIIRDLFHAVRGVIFNSEPEMELARRLYDIPAFKGTVVGMGLDAFTADPAKFARSRNLSSPYVMYAGRREPLKGTPLLLDYLDAFRSRTGRDVKLVLAGSGDVPAPEALLPHILDLGYASEEEKHEAMAGAAAFIHPSVNESFGIVLLEAFLARTPGLVHAKGEVLRWQCERSGAGMWFRHYPEFESMLLRLLDDADLRRRMGDAGRAYVLREYNDRAIGDRLFSALGVRV